MNHSPEMTSLLHHFAALKDPRQRVKVVHPFPEILLLVLCATIVGADDFVEVQHLGRAPHRLPVPVPAVQGRHPQPRCAERADERPEPRAVLRVLRHLGQQPARRRPRYRRGRRQDLPSHPRQVQGTPAAASGLRLGVTPAPRPRSASHRHQIQRNHRHPAAPRAPRTEGCAGHHRCHGLPDQNYRRHPRSRRRLPLAVKDNQPVLHDDIKRYIDDAPADELETFQTTDGDHDRIEVRRHAVSHKVDWLAGDSRFPGIKTIAMVENRVERNGETSCERRYYISSAILLAVLFANAVRCHWHFENRLHWVLDVSFREDLSRLRTGHGPHNMATVRHMAMNLLRSAKPGKSLKVRRKVAGWNPNYLHAILQGLA